MGGSRTHMEATTLSMRRHFSPNIKAVPLSLIFLIFKTRNYYFLGFLPLEVSNTELAGFRMVERLGGEWLNADTMEKLVLALEYPPPWA